MPSKQEKAEAIRQLVLNLGDVERTAQQTGIAKSTLHYWKNKLKSNEKNVFLDYTPKSSMIQRSYKQIRDKMLTEIQQLLDIMPHYKPHQSADLINAVSRLTDRLMKIEAALATMTPYEITVNIAHLPNEAPADTETIKF